MMKTVNNSSNCFIIMSSLDIFATVGLPSAGGDERFSAVQLRPSLVVYGGIWVQLRRRDTDIVLAIWCELGYVCVT